MSDRLPLTEVGGDELLARVTYQIILGDYRDHPDEYEIPYIRLIVLAEEWSLAGIEPIATDLRLAAIWVGNGGTVATWLRARVVFHAGRATKLAHTGRARRR